MDNNNDFEREAVPEKSEKECNKHYDGMDGVRICCNKYDSWWGTY